MATLLAKIRFIGTCLDGIDGRLCETATSVSSSMDTSLTTLSERVSIIEKRFDEAVKQVSATEDRTNDYGPQLTTLKKVVEY